jgi:hypothetical protein
LFAGAVFPFVFSVDFPPLVAKLVVLSCFGTGMFDFVFSCRWSFRFFGIFRVVPSLHWRKSMARPTLDLAFGGFFSA